MKKRKIKNLLLVKSSVANLNGAKHQLKGGNSVDFICLETQFPTQCDPEFTQNRFTCRGCDTFPPVCNSIDVPCKSFG